MLFRSKTPKNARVEILLGGAGAARQSKFETPHVGGFFTLSVVAGSFDAAQLRRLARLMEFQSRMLDKGLGQTYETAHAQLVLDCAKSVAKRDDMKRAGQLQPLSEASQIAADKLFVETVFKLCDGLEARLESYRNATEAKQRKMFELWRGSEKDLQR